MKIKKKIVVTSLVAVLALLLSTCAFAAVEYWNDNSSNKSISTDWTNWKTVWKDVKYNYEQVSLTPGAMESQLNFGWYSKAGKQAKVRMAATENMNDAVVFIGTSRKYKKLPDATGTYLNYYSNKVTATGLKRNTVYYYQYYVDSKWSKTYKYETHNSDSFSFLYVGDPQIGASKDQVAEETDAAQTAVLAARNDAFSWNTTLKTAVEAYKDVSFIVSAGDQINDSSNSLQQEIEYAAFLSPEILKSIPIATTIGNHDAKTANYKNHFNNPNSFTEEASPTAAGNGYYYTYGNVLFVTINTNNYNCADHEALLKKAAKANPDVIWRVVTLHHDIYGSGIGHSDSDSMILRTQLTKLMDKYDIDVVLQGHDHTYSRSYLLTGDGESHTSYDASVNLGNKAVKTKFKYQNFCYSIINKTSGTVTNPDGVLYMDANSSTGSKFYSLITTKQNYIASRSQTWEPTYSVIDVTNTSFTINTYEVSTGEKIDESYTIKKTDRVRATGVKLNKTSLIVKVGKTATLKATVSPKNTTDNVTFKSSNKKIATVNSKTGKVTAVKKGTCKITVLCGTKTKVCKVLVK